MIVSTLGIGYRIAENSFKGVSVDFEVAKNPTTFLPCYGSKIFLSQVIVHVMEQLLLGFDF